MKHKIDIADYRRLLGGGDLTSIKLPWGDIFTDVYKHEPSGIRITVRVYRFSTREPDVYAETEDAKVMSFFKDYLTIIGIN